MAFNSKDWLITASGYRDFFTGMRDNQILGSADAINQMASNMGVNLGDWYNQYESMYTDGFNLQKAITNGYAMAPTDVQTALFNQQLSKQMYDQTQSYGAQVQQMLDAGLNPALMYAGGSSNTGGAQAGQAEVSSFNPADGVSMFSQLFGQFANMASIMSTIKLQNAQADNIQAETDGKKIANANSQRQYDDQHLLANSNIKLNDANANGVTMQMYLDKQKIKTEQWNTLEAKYQSKIAGLESDMRDTLLQSTYELNEALRKQYETSSAKDRAEIWLYGFQAKKLSQDVKESIERVNNLAEQAGLYHEQAIGENKRNSLIEQDGFLRYVSTMIDFDNAMLNQYQVGSQAGNFTGAYELYENAISSSFESLRRRYGNSGFYAGSKNGYYPTVEAPIPFKSEDHKGYEKHGMQLGHIVMMSSFVAPSKNLAPVKYKMYNYGD